MSNCDDAARLPSGERMREIATILATGVLRQRQRAASPGENSRRNLVESARDGLDPHPAEGVRTPLSSVVKDFRFLMLRNCGHLPWIERQAKDEFFRVIREELRDATTGRK